jgi:hypothetical protein
MVKLEAICGLSGFAEGFVIENVRSMTRTWQTNDIDFCRTDRQRYRAAI